MRVTNLHLLAGEHLCDKHLSLTETYTHLEGPTGIGKTTWLLDVLAKERRLVLVVPTLSQLRQLKSEYGKRSSLAFVSGTDKKALERAEITAQTIICTYDQLGSVRRALGREEQAKRILVIDEAHKMYQAGGYRGSAIQNLLANFHTEMPWERVLTVSATFSRFLIKLAKLAPGEWITVTQDGRPARHFEVLYYGKRDFAQWPDAILARAKAPGRKGTMIVRVNSKVQIESLYHAYQKAGLRCQRIYADVQDEEQMRKLLAVQKIEHGVDILLTSSLIDEAINLKNPDGEVDSVHLIGSRAHPEEITQFIGRFRKANPPIFLHQSNEKVIGYCKEFPDPILVDEYEQAVHEALREDYQDSLAMAGALSRMLNTKSAPDIATLRLRVKELNSTHRRFFDVTPLRLVEGASVEHCRISENIGSLLAQIYREEAEASYGLYEFLERQLKRLIPGCVIARRDMVLEPRSDAIKDLFKDGEKVANEVMREVKREVSNKLRSLLRNRLKEDMAEAASAFAATFGANTLHGRVCQDFADVLAVVPDFDDADRIIWRDEKAAVLAAYDGLSDLIIKNLHAALKQRGFPIKVDGKEACKLVGKAASEAGKQQPQIKRSINSRRGQKSGLRTKDNSHITVDSRTALRMIRQNTCTTVTSDEEKEERKRGIVTVHGLYYGGYHYKGVNERLSIGRLEDEFPPDSSSATGAAPGESAEVKS